MADTQRPPCQLTQLVGAATLRDVQAALAATTRTAAAFIDGYGQAVVPPSSGSLFAALLGQSAEAAAAQQARFESAARDNAAAGWRTDADSGLLHYVAPVMSSARRIGTLVIGDRPAEPWTDAAAKPHAEHWHTDAAVLIEAGRRDGTWTEEERAAAAELAGVVAALLGRMCAQERRLQERIDELSVVYDLAEMLVGTRDLQNILDLTARKVCDVMQTKACSIRLLDEHTGELVIKAVHNLSEAYLQKGPVLVAQSRIDSIAIQGNVVYIEDAPTDPRVRYPQDAQREGIVSGLVAGMTYHGRPVGVIRVYTERKHRFTPFEESLLRAVAAQAAVAIVNARFYHAAIEAERYERQLKYAGAVQRRMIPAAPPQRDSIAFGCLYRASREVGGDFYDFIELPGGNVGVAVADVVGKGLPAGLMMASLRSALRVYTYHIYDVDRIVAQVNNHMCRETQTNEFATLFYGVLTPDGRRMTYCNAGHEPPLLLRDGRVQPLEVGGMAVGIVENSEFEKAVLELQPGDVMLCVTDGVVESMNFNDEEFGRKRLAESLLRYGDLEPAQIVNNVLWDVRRHIGLSDLADDMTLVALRIRRPRPT